MNKKAELPQAELKTWIMAGILLVVMGALVYAVLRPAQESTTQQRLCQQDISVAKEYYRLSVASKTVFKKLPFPERCITQNRDFDSVTKEDAMLEAASLLEECWAITDSGNIGMFDTLFESRDYPCFKCFRFSPVNFNGEITRDELLNYASTTTKNGKALLTRFNNMDSEELNDYGIPIVSATSINSIRPVLSTPLKKNMDYAVIYYDRSDKQHDFVTIIREDLIEGMRCEGEIMTESKKVPEGYDMPLGLV